MAAMSGDIYRGREVEAPSLLLFVGSSQTRMPFSQIGTCGCLKQHRIQIDMPPTCTSTTSVHKGMILNVYIAYHIKKAGAALLLPHAALPQEELLRVAGNLRRGSSRDVAPGDASPVTLSELLEADKE